MNPTTNRIYVTDADGVSVLDGRTNTVIATVPVGNHPPWAVAVNSNTNRVYAISSIDGNNTVSVLDGHTNTLLAKMRVGRNPIAIAVNTKLNRVYVCNYFDSTMSVFQGY